MRRKSEKEEKQTPPPNTTAPVKRGPGRPPGSNNKNNQNQDKLKQTGVTAGEPPVKKLKDDPKESVPPLVQGAPLTPQNKPKDPAPSLLGSPKNNPLKWNVQQVCDFIKNLPGCSDYVEDFAVQEIDGQALMLLQADHLMTAMSIKLGPALKICEQVKVLKDEMAKNWRQQNFNTSLDPGPSTSDTGQQSSHPRLASNKKIVLKMGENILAEKEFQSDSDDDDNALVMDFSDSWKNSLNKTFLM